MATFGSYSTKASRTAAQAFAAAPPSSGFTPVPYKLLQVAVSRGEEVVAPNHGDFTGIAFDPWQKGDLVAVRVKHTSWKQGEGTTAHFSWHVGRRASTPSGPVMKIDIGGASPLRMERGSNNALFRIPYRYLNEAANLVGREFASREELELALDGVKTLEIAA